MEKKNKNTFTEQMLWYYMYFKYENCITSELAQEANLMQVESRLLEFH